MDIEPLLAAHGRVLIAAQVNDALSRRQRAAALRTGVLVRVHPDIYACGPVADDLTVRWRAALAYTGNRGALGYVSGLAAHGVTPALIDDPVHVVTSRAVGLRGDARVVVHRRAHFDSDDADVVRRDGLAMLSIERCLIDTWQLRSPERRRAELITAVRGRRTSVERVRAELAGVAIPDRAELEQLLELLAAGCASELEMIWGHLHVFTGVTGAGMPPFARQFRVTLGGSVRYIDLAHVCVQDGGRAGWLAVPRWSGATRPRPSSRRPAGRRRLAHRPVHRGAAARGSRWGTPPGVRDHRRAFASGRSAGICLSEPGSWCGGRSVLRRVAGAGAPRSRVERCGEQPAQHRWSGRGCPGPSVLRR